jgi:hypothetical protein
MAQHEILGSFERVHYDQWQYLTLDDPITAAARRVCFDPRLRADWWTDRNPFSTATGPNSERLYSIHVAPGESTSLESSANLEEKCLRLLQAAPKASDEGEGLLLSVVRDARRNRSFLLTSRR